MNIKVDFDNIVVKEDKNDFNVKVLMLKGEKGDPGDGEPNVIEEVQVNGTALPVTNKTVNVTVPIVDSTISSSSTNPVQNNAIYNALSNKVDTSELNNYYETSEVDALLNDKADGTTTQNQINAINTALNTKASTSELETLSSQVSALSSGSPLVASSVSEMEDTTKTYVNTTDGNWYYYDGSNWQIGGTYQSSGIGENEIKTYNLDTQMIKKINTLGDEQNSLITHTFPFSYSDTSNHIIVYQEDSTQSLTLPTGRYMAITKLKFNSLTSGATIQFRQVARYKLGSGSTSNYMVSENIHDAIFTSQEIGVYKYAWGTINATDTIQYFRPGIAFVNNSHTNPVAGEYYIETFWLFKVDDNSDTFYNDVLQRINYYDYQVSYPILNLTENDKNALIGDIEENIKDSIKYIPDYLETYITNKIKSFEPSDKELSFIFQTDHHLNSQDIFKNPILNAIKTSNVLMHNLPLEINLFGGDYVANASDTTKQQYKDYMRIYNDEIENDNKVILLRGNHDVNQMNSNTSQQLTDSEIFNIIGKKYLTNHLKIVTNNSIPNAMYGYIDFDFQKIRLVFVNTSDGYNQNLKIGMGNMNTTQLQWLADNCFTLPNNKTDYQVIVVGHYPIYNFSDGSEVEEGRLNGFKLLLEAFRNGTNLNYTAWGNNYKVTKDFSVQGAKTLICYLCGHTHYDANYTSNTGILQIATTNAGYYNKENDGGTVNQFAYDIVKINPISKTISFERIGKGSDRSFTYE